MTRRYFGTDGVRGVVGEQLTAELVSQLGRALIRASGPGRVLVGRDTRASGVELESALAAGIAAAGGQAVLGGVLPTAAVARGALDLGAMITASHNPPAYNGVKFFHGDGSKLSDAEEEEIESLLGEPFDYLAELPAAAGERAEGMPDRYLDFVVERFGSDLGGLSIVVDCANGSYAQLAPRAFAELGAEVRAVGNTPNGANINTGCGAADTALLRETLLEHRADLGIAFDGDGDRITCLDERGELVDGDGIIALLALDLGVELVCVTQMTNLGFHRLMEERGVRVVTTEVGDRYVLEALVREGGVLGGEQSGHVVYLQDHVAGDGLTAGLLVCAALKGRSLSEAAALERYPQVMYNVKVASKRLSVGLAEAIEREQLELGSAGRILVRPSGTEPLVRVLVEAAERGRAEEVCARLAALVEIELG
jgi:phosphoglucosamine mutase